MPRRVRKIGVLTSGGDSPGMNAAVRAVVRTALEEGLKIFGFQMGYRGLVNGIFRELDFEDVGGILQKGGTFLQTARFREFEREEVQNQAVDVIEDLELESLIIIGGEGSMHGAYALSRKGVPVIGIPASIDNDIYGTDDSIGVDTALNTIVRAVDTIKDTASSHGRAFIIEVMGHNSGYLALLSAIATGAEAAIIPEKEFDYRALAKRLNKRYREGLTNSIVIVSEGAARGFHVLKTLNELGVDYELRVTVLGHLQRGGSPTFYDRIIASRFGYRAVHTFLSGKSGVMVAKQCDNYNLVSLEEVVNNRKEIPEEYLKMADTLMWEY
ncbi:MAG TPA: 6-phosphofructokinase [candidate division WOR-3 bacterium]|uniref:ATP-dependent 6-phosphofructokinase n=1 Tax=candidate division WOR-3 bacterium TaxID=2052148 RepID=A0A7C1BAN5_UNCW3|nr:MAG: 6-phosphofructokinase [Candidatus Hydrothermae bacterium]HDM90611.1 6-phosphofructokinase [candidate division WOR-3 bacterium]